MSLRWKNILRPQLSLPGKHALRVTLVGCCLNALAPAKTGDLVKAHDLYRRKISLTAGVGAVLWEKYYDFAFLFTVTGVSIFFVTPEFTIVAYGLLILVFFSTLFFFFSRRFAVMSGLQAFRPSPSLFFRLLMLTAVNWTIQFVQIVLFFWAFQVYLPVPVILVRTLLAIFIGLIPISIAGMGTRDAALLYFLGGLVPEPRIVALGLLLSFRYWFPALLGLPATLRYVSHSSSPPAA